MTRLDESTKSKINRLYFKENMTIPQISGVTKVPYPTVLNAVDRGDIYKMRNGHGKTKNNKEVIDLIVSVVAEYFGLVDSIITMKTRIGEILIPRQIAQTISYNLTKSSNAFIGREIGGLNSSTVTNSRKVINQLLSYKNDVSSDYLKIEEICIKKIKEYETTI